MKEDNLYHIPAMIVGMFLFASFLCSCSNTVEEVKKFTDENILPVQTSFNSTIYYTDSAKVKGKLFANKLEQYEGDSSYTLMPEGVILKFYDPKENPESTLSANYGIIFGDQSAMQVKDNVIVKNIKGEKLETSSLIWLRDSSRIETEDAIKITKEDAIINGIGLTANENFSRYKIKNITGIVYLNENDSISNGEIP